ncbi:MAG: tRNA threonylcarbamoyladenosine dehydratase [Clostridiales bacterium]|nr:tRNA threonylcarbamoyladenosine dehydratase [Clostridiales bacterium]
MRYTRQIPLLGDTAPIHAASAAVFGLGGVGGGAVEALARAGIGRLLLCDCDVFEESNLNRQLLCTERDIGRPKTEAAAERVSIVNRAVEISAAQLRVTPENAAGIFDDFFGSFGNSGNIDGQDEKQGSRAGSRSQTNGNQGFRAVIDAMDDVTAKLAVIEEAKRRGIYVISCMGTGNRLDPAAFRVADIAKTSGCPLARVMRRECRLRGISVDCVYSTEEPISTGDRTPASVSFVPPVAGMIMAGEVLKRAAGIANG